MEWNYLFSFSVPSLVKESEIFLTSNIFFFKGEEKKNYKSIRIGLKVKGVDFFANCWN